VTRTIAYVRVSTDKQTDRGVSLDAQRAKVRAYAELYELELVEVIVDAGASAKTLERPGLQRALAMLKRGHADALLVVKLDRSRGASETSGTSSTGTSGPERPRCCRSRSKSIRERRVGSWS
jgi:DNA invertase Pin-like site-specific DNA recombinase